MQGSWPGRAMWCKKRLLKAHSQQKSYYILRIILRQVISIWIYLFFLFSGTKLDRNWSFLGSELLFIARISHAHLVVLAAHISRPMVHMPSCFQILASHPLAHNLWLVNMVCWNYMFHSAHLGRKGWWGNPQKVKSLILLSLKVAKIIIIWF